MTAQLVPIWRSTKRLQVAAVESGALKDLSGAASAWEIVFNAELAPLGCAFIMIMPELRSFVSVTVLGSKSDLNLMPCTHQLSSDFERPTQSLTRVP